MHVVYTFFWEEIESSDKSEKRKDNNNKSIKTWRPKKCQNPSPFFYPPDSGAARLVSGWLVHETAYRVTARTRAVIVAGQSPDNFSKRRTVQKRKWICPSSKCSRIERGYASPSGTITIRYIVSLLNQGIGSTVLRGSEVLPGTVRHGCNWAILLLK